MIEMEHFTALGMHITLLGKTLGFSFSFYLTLAGCYGLEVSPQNS